MGRSFLEVLATRTNHIRYPPTVNADVSRRRGSCNIIDYVIWRDEEQCLDKAAPHGAISWHSPLLKPKFRGPHVLALML